MKYTNFYVQCKSLTILNANIFLQKFFRRKNIRDLLPSQPIEDIVIEPWWTVQAGYITEDDVKFCSTIEKHTIDKLIDTGDKPITAGKQDHIVLHCKMFSYFCFFHSFTSIFITNAIL